MKTKKIKLDLTGWTRKEIKEMMEYEGLKSNAKKLQKRGWMYASIN